MSGVDAEKWKGFKLGAQKNRQKFLKSTRLKITAPRAEYKCLIFSPSSAMLIELSLRPKKTKFFSFMLLLLAFLQPGYNTFVWTLSKILRLAKNA